MRQLVTATLMRVTQLIRELCVPMGYTGTQEGSGSCPRLWLGAGEVT